LQDLILRSIQGLGLWQYFKLVKHDCLG